MNFLPIISLIIFQLGLLLYGGYFLSPEFSLYPYLFKNGLLPYQEIIDQHLPILFFGPLSLPSFITYTSQSLLILFIFVTVSTTYLFWLLIKKQSPIKRFTLTFAWVCLWIIFEGRVLWIETFVVPLILFLLLLKDKKRSSTLFLSGICLGLLLLLRPSLAPFFFLFLIFLKINPLQPYFLSGFLTPFLLNLIFLSKNNLINNFLQLVFVFNKEVYVKEAIKTPILTHYLTLSVFFLPILSVLLYKKKFLELLSLLSLLILAYPRFELFHLLPFVSLAIFFVSDISIKRRLIFFFIIPLFFFTIFKSTRHRVGNFYSLLPYKEVITYIKNNSENTIYIFGGPDLLYLNTNRLPAGFFYLPSLPWYLSQDDLVNAQIKALRTSPSSIILINKNSHVDGVKISTLAPALLEYINKQYKLSGTISDYDIYRRL